METISKLVLWIHQLVPRKGHILSHQKISSLLLVEWTHPTRGHCYSKPITILYYVNLDLMMLAPQVLKWKEKKSYGRKHHYPLHLGPGELSIGRKRILVGCSARYSVLLGWGRVGRLGKCLSNYICSLNQRVQPKSSSTTTTTENRGSLSPLPLPFSNLIGVLYLYIWTDSSLDLSRVYGFKLFIH